ncbi:translation initiation factor SUI1 [Bacteriovorax sp. BAL6_X]|uniref:translation initiation factor SUI1 n=1 Tax=Bacteriovorax sp. BAL6_X TaxID=1201290 RepID=UPI0003865812|nr:translation initiation factor SUI1 [Bacteriovorax sp. BAL6_X]EPZ50076.1 translation initiation factor SUI1 [Bacteriovorax sp. BAL6_X]
MKDAKLVWSDEAGDLRKKNSKNISNEEVNESELVLEIRRLTSGKGRAIVEISGLPANKKWCQKLAKDLKKTLGVGGAFKNDYIEVHGEKLDQVKILLNKKKLQWKQTGG